MGISTFGPYRAAHPLQGPKLPIANPDERRILTNSDGVQAFSDAPCPVQKQDLNPSGEHPHEDKRCLWVICARDVPFIPEHAPVAPPLQSGVCKHTNLTGGADAHCGGEVWFVSGKRLILNGASGRYPPRHQAELQEIATAFRNAGYQVWSMGWDNEANCAARVPRGHPPWKVQK